ncbi:hypothetical protein CP791_06075 [Salmonella enterica]|nr:hypothetical protein [Salmonella enterica]
MRRILATAAALCLGGCITVYGPVKTGGQQQQDSQSGQQPGMSEQISTSFIGNRKPDELLNAVDLYFREKAITASVNDQTTGIIAGIYNLLREYEGRVTVKVLGIAASAASVIAMAGDDIQIGRGAFLMIHNCWVVAMGGAVAEPGTSESG